MAITYKLEISNKPKIDGTYLIMLRITENRKPKRISTGVFIKPYKDFNKDATYGKWIKSTNPDSVFNDKLKKFIKSAKISETQLAKRGLPVTLPSIIKGINNDNINSFTAYYKEQVKLIKDTHSIGYYKHLNSKLNNLIKFQSNILFSEINVTLLKRFKQHLKTNGLSDNSITSNLKAFRTMLYSAYEEDLHEGPNPFIKKSMKLPDIKGNKKRLSKEDIITIENLDLIPNSTLWHVRNYFLFAFYCSGMRIGDLIQLKWKSVQNDKLNYLRDKGGEGDILEITLIDKAKAILELYTPINRKQNDFVFPLLNSKHLKASDAVINNAVSSKTAIINRNLKKIAEMAKLNLNLTTHVSRHSYADILRKSGASIHEISNLLGHSDIKVTQRYLQNFDSETATTAHNKAMDF